MVFVLYKINLVYQVVILMQEIELFEYNSEIHYKYDKKASSVLLDISNGFNRICCRY